MRRSRVLVSVAVGALVATLAPLSAASAVSAASAATIRCGDTITKDVVLTKNLRCRGDGLSVGTGLTINLNGHTLAGSGVGVGIAGSGATVTNGTIRGFDIGARVVETRSVKFVSNRLGMKFEYGGGVRVVDSTFDSNRAGLVIGIGNVTVTGSTFRRNGIGVGCGDADVHVTRSRFVDNETGVSGSVCGVRLSDNRFSGGHTAVSLRSAGYFVDVRNNSFSGSGIGLDLFGIAQPSTHAIVGNTFKNNLASGLVVRASTPTFGFPVTVSGNTFRGNGFSPGANVDPTGIQLTSGVWANAGTFTNNTARGNAGHGIEVYNAVDGGGNTARGNRALPQCLGVVCATR